MTPVKKYKINYLQTGRFGLDLGLGLKMVVSIITLLGQQGGIFTVCK